MKEYETISTPDEVIEKNRRLRRQFLRYKETEIVYSLTHRKLLGMAGSK